MSKSNNFDAIIKPAKLDYIDALRGIAILAVILIHTEFLVPGSEKNLPTTFSALVAAGKQGVQLFFVASAFTMFYSLSRRRGGERNPTLNFFLRRFFRIAPCYWLGIVGYSLWYYYVDHRTFSAANITAEFLFIHGISPHWINNLQPGGWSITVEMCFYLLVPFLFTYITSLNRAVGFLLVTLGLNMLLQTSLAHWPLIDTSTSEGWAAWNTFRESFLPAQLPVFALGFILYFLSQPHSSGPVSPLYLLVSALLVVGVLALGSYSSLGIDVRDLRDQLINQHIVMSTGFVLLALALSRQPYKILVNPITRYFGTLSFSLYLCHFLIIFIMNRAGWINFIAPNYTAAALVNFFIRFIVICIGSLPLAYLLHQLVEKPGQRLGKKLIERLEFPSKI